MNRDFAETAQELVGQPAEVIQLALEQTYDMGRDDASVDQSEHDGYEKATGQLTLL